MDKYTAVAPQSSIDKTVAALKENGFHPIVVENKAEALSKMIELIPDDVSIMNGASVTLEEIGFIEYLKGGGHKWNNLHEAILGEQDQAKQALLRRQSVVSDFYTGSAHSITENGEIMIASNTGSQLPHLAFTSPNVIIVAGAQKITANITEAFKRLEEHVIPLEDERMKGVYGMGTTHAKTLILHKENPFMGRKITVIIVKEKLGF
ncbi:MAG: lactate utilization protein [Candidatus Dojkabacteria bacterium]|nr:MAG: lactate utilization protein [Candidatus Dojkabacteria bacterium]